MTTVGVGERGLDPVADRGAGGAGDEVAVGRGDRFAQQVAEADRLDHRGLGVLGGDDDLHLGSGKERELLGQRDILVPRRDDRQPSRAAPNRDLALPLVQEPLDERESLAAAGIAEPAHALDQRRLERRAVAPPLAEPLGVGALERAPEADAGVAHRDHHDPPAEPAPEGVRLHRDPAAGAGVLNNILASLRKRHTEPERGLQLEAELAVQDARGALRRSCPTTSCTSSEARTGVTSSSTSDGPVAAGSRHFAVHLEQLGGIAEEAGPRPVALHVVAARHREQRPLALRLRQRLAGGQHADQPVGRGPLGAAGVDQQPAPPAARRRSRRRTGRSSGRRSAPGLR